MRQRRVFIAGFAALCALWSKPSNAAMAWKIVYLDEGTSRGFHDPTAATPVGGNRGRTLGEQRRIAFEAAVRSWAAVLSSSVPITIEAQMLPLPCDEKGAILGQASPAAAVAMPAIGGARRLTYPIALANALDGSDLEPPSSENPTGAELLAEFNSELGKAGCLEGSGFYLGLDGRAGDESDFLGVVLHELGHGFGFSSFIDYATGEPLFDDAPDGFSTHAFDLDRQIAWDGMSPTQLLDSLTNARRVVWNGAHVTQAVPRYLVKGSPRLTVTPPVSGFSGQLSEHDDSPKPSEQPATGPLVVPTPASGCERPNNPGRIAGAVVLVDPGEACHPLEAVAIMEVLGAEAVIAVDPTGVRPPAMISGILEGQTIPVVTIHGDDAVLLAAQAVGRTVTLDGDPTRYVGTDSNGRILLNVTDPIVEGTSISHWDALARNQLLMEPERSAGHLDIDLTREFMWDLGWPVCGDGRIGGLEECDDANAIDSDSCHLNCTKSSTASAGAGNGTSDPVEAAATGDGKQVSCSCRLHDRGQPMRNVAVLLGIVWALRARRGSRRPA